MGSSHSTGYKRANGTKKRIRNHHYNLTTPATTFETRAAATPSPAPLTFGYDEGRDDQVNLHHHRRHSNNRATTATAAVDRRSNGSTAALRAGGGEVDRYDEDDDEYVDLRATEYIARVREKLRLQNESDDPDMSESSAAAAGGHSGGDSVSPPSIDAQAEAYISSVRQKFLLENRSKRPESG